jgi:uncharacterized membrane protein
MALGHGLAARVYPDVAGGGVGAPRRGLLLGAAAAFLVGFAALRVMNLGDASLWSAQPGPLGTALSFVNVSKYPPSTPFLLMTLAGALLALAAFSRWPRAGRILEVYGRVPLLFYVVHIPLIHAIAVIYSRAVFGAASWLTSGPVIFWDVALPGSPPSYGLGLGAVWAVWFAFVAALYPLCRWYGRRR